MTDLYISHKTRCFFRPSRHFLSILTALRRFAERSWRVMQREEQLVRSRFCSDFVQVPRRDHTNVLSRTSRAIPSPHQKSTSHRCCRLNDFGYRLNVEEECRVSFDVNSDMEVYPPMPTRSRSIVLGSRGCLGV